MGPGSTRWSSVVVARTPTTFEGATRSSLPRNRVNRASERINHHQQWSTVLSRVLYRDGWRVATMPMRSFGAFGPEAIAAMSEAFDAACKELGDTGQPEVAREVIAGRIIAAARFGERDPVRLREAALRKPD
jgi:hypothetical protein